MEACIRQRVVQSLRSGEKRERVSWTKRGMSLILLTSIPIRSVTLVAILALHASNFDDFKPKFYVRKAKILLLANVEAYLE